MSDVTPAPLHRRDRSNVPAAAGAPSDRRVLVLHDTTVLRFNSEREGLGGSTTMAAQADSGFTPVWL
jgi:hypothetical protein